MEIENDEMLKIADIEITLYKYIFLIYKSLLIFQCHGINSFYFKLCLYCLIHIGKYALWANICFCHQTIWPWYDKLPVSCNNK